MLKASTRMWRCLLVAVMVGAGWCAPCAAQVDPTITSWYFRFYGRVGDSPDPVIDPLVSVIPADIQQVKYTPANTYVMAAGVPSYPVGPFPDGNPNYPSDVAWVARFSRSPIAKTPPKTPTPLAAIGLWANGVAVFNAKDAHSYLDLGVWNQNAVVVEADGFDAALGHPAGLGASGPPPRPGMYHHHQNPIALRPLLRDDGSRHSPILGYAFDAFPIYGPYGYANPDGTGGVKRMRSSYRLRGITVRTTRPDGTPLPMAQYGPPVSATYPLGYYIEDYEYVAGLGDLDAHNGRFEVTHEYPGGIYAYHATIDAAGASAYPYTIGPSYYGVVMADTVARTVTVPGMTTTFSPCSIPLSVTINPVPVGVCAGGDAQFSILASGIGGSGPFGYQWEKDGLAVADVPGHISGSSGAVLSIVGVRPEEAGSYLCHVTSACGGAASTAAALTVCIPDLNCDGLVDFGDYLEFLNLYVAQDPRVDFNRDGLVDFSDYLEFLNHFDAGC